MQKFLHCALLCAFALCSSVAPVKSSDKRTDKLYELYNSTSTPENYKRILKRRIDGLERVEKARGKARRYPANPVLSPSAPARPIAVLSAQPQAADDTFRLGEVYCFPNPAKRTDPAFHIETGLADKIELKIYDVAGDLVHETSLTGRPQVIDDGQGAQYAYEYLWSVKNTGSGVYIFSVTARKGDKTLRKSGRCAIIK